MRIKDIIREGVHDPGIFKAVFMLGSPGSGKSTVLDLFVNPSARGLKILNVDEVYKRLVYIDGIVGGYEDEIYKQGGIEMARLQDLYIQDGQGLAIDRTGRDLKTIKDTKQKLESFGYDTIAIFVDVELNTALNRNEERVRKADEQYIRSEYPKIYANKEAFNLIFGEDFIVFDNNVDEFRNSMRKHRQQLEEFFARPVSRKHKLSLERPTVTEDYSQSHIDDAKYFVNNYMNDIQPWLDNINHNLDNVVYRGLETTITSVEKVTNPVVDRKPVDSPTFLHNNFNSIIRQNNLVANRSNSIFTTGSREMSLRYGNPYVILPIGNFHFTWSTDFKDWFKIASLRGKPELLNAQLDELSNSLAGDDESLIEAIKSGHEIMLHCPNGYFIVPESVYEVIFHLTR